MRDNIKHRQKVGNVTLQVGHERNIEKKFIF